MEKTGAVVGKIFSYRPLTLTTPLYMCWATMRLDDMQDLALMIDGKFRKRSNFFEFDKTFQKLKKMVQIRASIKNVEV